MYSNTCYLVLQEGEKDASAAACSLEIENGGDIRKIIKVILHGAPFYVSVGAQQS